MCLLKRCCSARFKRTCYDVACVLSDENSHARNLAYYIVGVSHEPGEPLHYGSWDLSKVGAFPSRKAPFCCCLPESM